MPGRTGRDRCKAEIGHHFDCPLDNMFLGFAGIKGSDLRDFVATGADDAAIGKWIEEHATKRPRIEIIKWNNGLRYKRVSELPDEMQEFMEDYIPANVPGAVIHHIRYFFDIFDAEEKRFVLTKRDGVAWMRRWHIQVSSLPSGRRI